MINMENYEGYLYLYQEGELDSATRTEVERFLLEHPDIREEMETYYDPSLVVTAEPPTRKKRQVVPLYRWSTAASILIAISLLAYLLIPATGNRESLVAANRPSTPESDSLASELPHNTISETEGSRLVASNIALPVRPPKRALANTPATPHLSDATIQDNSENETAAILPVDHTPYSQQASQVESIAENPHPTSDIIYCDCLAVDAITVDNLAEEVPNSNAFPSTQTNLANLMIASSSKKRQELLDFFLLRKTDQEQPTQLALVIN